MSHPIARRAARRMLLLALLLALPGAQAHDFWLSADRAAAASPPALRLWVGHRLQAEESRPYDAAGTDRFRLYRGEGMRDLAASARDGAEPFHLLPRDVRAPALIALDRKPVDIALPGAKFDAYLAEEHLQDVLAQREGQAAVEGRERYTRHIKVLVGGGDEASSLHARRVGQALEIVLLDAPGTPAPGRTLRAQVLFAGKPLAGRTLTVLDDADARFDDDDARLRTVKTDARGIARFAYDRPGFWLLRLVHMQPCREDCGRADWRSWWAAYAIQSDWRAPR